MTRSQPGPPAPDEILVRARALTATALLAQAHTPGAGASASHGNVAQIARAIATAPVRAAFTDDERLYFHAPSDTGPLHARMSWQTVAAGVLLWAIGRLDQIPAPTRAPDERAILSALLEIPTVTPDDHLRDAAERHREWCVAWHWAYRVDARVGGAPDSAIAWCASSVAGINGPDAVIADHLAVDGAPFASINDETFETIAAIAPQRRRALGWLNGNVHPGEDADTAAWDRVVLEM